MGWTGMASASSLANFGGGGSGGGEKGLETIEIDPQFANGLGFNQGDIVGPLLLAPSHTPINPANRSRSDFYTTSP